MRRQSVTERLTITRKAQRTEARNAQSNPVYVMLPIDIIRVCVSDCIPTRIDQRVTMHVTPGIHKSRGDPNGLIR